MGWKKLRQIPVKQLILWITVTLLLLFLTVEVCLPYDHTLESLQTQEITLREARLKVPVGKHHNWTLRLTSQEDKQYVLQFRSANSAIEQDLLSGQAVGLTAKVFPRSLPDILFRRHRIAALESGDTVYHTLEQTRVSLRGTRAGIWAGWVLCLFFWMPVTFFHLASRKSPVFRKSKKKS